MAKNSAGCLRRELTMESGVELDDSMLSDETVGEARTRAERQWISNGAVRGGMPTNNGVACRAAR